MKAGFARVCITPPLGTPMMGFAARDRAHGCTGIHDDIFVRAVYLEHAGQAILIMGFDLCFIGRADSNQFKEAIGRKIRLVPRQILLNTSHNHAGPAVGTWYDAHPSREYLKQLEMAVVSAAVQSRESAREVTIWGGITRSFLPMNRRRKDESGNIELRPNPGGFVYNYVPVCLLKDLSERPVCLLFSVSCHPVMMIGWEISAEYPGIAMDKLDAHLGTHASLFLQGAGGSANPYVYDEDSETWRPCNTWEKMTQVGQMVAGETIQAIKNGLVQIQPEMHSELLEVHWPMQPLMSRDEYTKIAARQELGETKCLWAQRIVDCLDRGKQLPASVPIFVQGMQIGKGLRLVGLEGELVAELGLLIQKFYKNGITFPLGYTNGEGLYMPTSDMIDEGGYEAESYWEYGFPAPLARGFENILTQALAQLFASGVE